MNVTDVIATLATGTYEVTRPSGAFAQGRWVDGADQVLQVLAVVQPASARELARLPEGQRMREVLAIWTATELQLRDRLAYRGASYELEAVEFWEAGGFWKGLAARRDT